MGLNSELINESNIKEAYVGFFHRNKIYTIDQLFDEELLNKSMSKCTFGMRKQVNIFKSFIAHKYYGTKLLFEDLLDKSIDLNPSVYRNITTDYLVLLDKGVKNISIGDLLCCKEITGRYILNNFLSYVGRNYDIDEDVKVIDFMKWIVDTIDPESKYNSLLNYALTYVKVYEKNKSVIEPVSFDVVDQALNSKIDFKSSTTCIRTLKKEFVNKG